MRRFIDKYSAGIFTIITTIIFAGYVDIRILLAEIHTSGTHNQTTVAAHIEKSEVIFLDYLELKLRVQGIIRRQEELVIQIKNLEGER